MNLSDILYAIMVPSFGQWGVITLVLAILLWGSKGLVNKLSDKQKASEAKAWAEQQAANHQRMEAEHRAYLMGRHNDPEVVNRIMRKEVWEGQSRLALEDSLGQPYHRDKMGVGDSLVDVWKYEKDVFGDPKLTVYLENNVVFDVVWRQYNNEDFIREMEILDRLDRSDWNLWKT